MAVSERNHFRGIDRTRFNFIFAIALLWGIVAAISGAFFLSEYGFSSKDSKYYLFPWCLATGAAAALPSVILAYKGKFNPLHPLVYFAWTFFIPSCFLGGIFFALGISDAYFQSYIQDESYNLPLTFFYIIVGYLAMSLGYALPYGQIIGKRLATVLPKWNLSDRDLLVPGYILLFLGIANTLLAYALGSFGFQRVREYTEYDGLVYLLSLWWQLAAFLLWLYVFRQPRINTKVAITIFFLITTALGKAAFQGNRASLLPHLIMIGFAFILSGRRPTLKHYISGAALLIVAVFAGMIYGTTFRNIKQTEEQVSFGQYAEMVGTTFSRLSEQDIGTTISLGLNAFANRIDAVSSLAVVVSNYEALAPYEEQIGIANNIWVDTVTFFIPRLIWKDKPVAIEPAKYADLYFNFSDNSFTMTPIGDLLRNFGPLGIPIGMLILGLFFRIMYRSLIDGQPFSFWRSAIFYMTISITTFEGTYGLIVPNMFKVGTISFAGLMFVIVLTKLRAGTGKLYRF